MGALLGLLGSATGGGIIGIASGLFTKFIDRGERLKMAQIELDRDKLEQEENALQHSRSLELLKEGAVIEAARLETETDAAIDIATMDTLAEGIKTEFQGLNTTSKMDNLRASVRPVFAYFVMFVFSVLLIWTFKKFRLEIDTAAGLALLTMLFDTLI